MTGAAAPGFEPLDTTVRQFMLWRCVGAAAVAMSYRGELVYSRGFGRMNGRATEDPFPGCGDDEVDPYDPDAELVTPSTPMLLGSVSKPIAAAVARRLVRDRLAELGGCTPELCACVEPCADDPLDARLTAPALDLLPTPLRELVHGEAPLPVPIGPRPCTPGADPLRADPRWRDITVGHLLAHEAGLPKSAPQYLAGTPNSVDSFAAIRGYESEADWAAEHARARALAGLHVASFDAAHEWLEGQLDAPVYFVHRFDARDEGSLDEAMKLLAGRCLEYSPGHGGSYSNSGASLLGTLIDHLQTRRNGGAFAAEAGDPLSYTSSALHEFLAEELGIEGGVVSREGVFQRYAVYPPAPGQASPQPVPRIWTGGRYYPWTGDQKRPFCVFHDGACDLGPWRDGRLEGSLASRAKALDGLNLRPRWDFQLADEGFAETPNWASGDQRHAASGGLAAEAPILLRFLNEFHVSSESGDRENGARREGWRPGWHNGSLAGGQAYTMQLGGDTITRELPRLEDGVFTDAFDDLEPVEIELPEGLDIVILLNQNADARCELTSGELSSCESEYAVLKYMVIHAVQGIDWERVDSLGD